MENSYSIVLYNGLWARAVPRVARRCMILSRLGVFSELGDYVWFLICCAPFPLSPSVEGRQIGLDKLLNGSGVCKMVLMTIMRVWSRNSFTLPQPACRTVVSRRFHWVVRSEYLFEHLLSYFYQGNSRIEPFGMVSWVLTFRNAFMLVSNFSFQKQLYLADSRCHDRQCTVSGWLWLLQSGDNSWMLSILDGWSRFSVVSTHCFYHQLIDDLEIFSRCWLMENQVFWEKWRLAVLTWWTYRYHRSVLQISRQYTQAVCKFVQKISSYVN